MLERIRLPGGGRETTRLGFGGSGLMGGLSERESLRLLETAFDAGIRHFDVAPAYGHGQAERCLGKFLRGLHGGREQITVATKYGIVPPRRAHFFGIASDIARPALRQLPAVRKRVAQAAAGLKSKAQFSAEEVRRSLDHSRRELGIDRIDVWLLHEVTADDLDGSDLLPFLVGARQQGLIASFGVGTERRQLDALWKRHRESCPVLQFEWFVRDEGRSFPDAFLIRHRAISGCAGTIRNLFEREPDLCRRWSDEVDADLYDASILAGTLLQAALAANPGGMILFSSRKPEHIRANVKAVEDPMVAERGKRLLELIAERHPRLDRT